MNCISRNLYKLIPFSFRTAISLKQDVRVATKPEPCISPALCQDHADLPEHADIDDELDCPGEPADEEYPESSGMLTVLVRNALASHSVVAGQMMKTTTSILYPPPLPYHLPHLCFPLPLPTAMNHLVPPVSFALLALGIVILPWKLKPLLRGKGTWLPKPNGFPVAQTMKRSLRSGERRLVWHVISVASVRLLAGNHQKVLWIGPASEFFFLFFFLPIPTIPFLFGFGNLTGSLPF